MIFDDIKEMILDELNVPAEKVTMEASLVDDLGADSLDAVELVMNIEEKYSITVDDDAAASIKTVGDIVKYVEGLVK